MVPTLFGRLQTRVALLASVGVAITVLVGPLLPGTGSASVGSVYRAAFGVLAAVLLLGLVWEFVYHGLMQLRWEKDWPSLFGLLTLVPEGLLLWGLLALEVPPLIALVDHAPAGVTFWTHFMTVWLAVWLFANGPMRIPFVRWRFHGGRLV